MNPNIVVHAFALYAWNVQPSLWVSDVFGWAISNDYHLEKLRLAERGILAFYASLDEDNQAKLVRVAMDKYSHEAEARAIRTDRYFKLLADNGV